MKKTELIQLIESVIDTSLTEKHKKDINTVLDSLKNAKNILINASPPNIMNKNILKRISRMLDEPIMLVEKEKTKYEKI